MSEGLFDVGPPADPPTPPDPAPAREEQVGAIRSGLDEAGILGQRDRQAFVEGIILTTVESLRDLTAVQARRVIDQLKDCRNRSSVAEGSLWDNREKDTWIDRL